MRWGHLSPVKEWGQRDTWNRQNLKGKFRKEWWLEEDGSAFLQDTEVTVTEKAEAGEEAEAEAETLNSERKEFVPLWFGQLICAEDKRAQIDYLGEEVLRENMGQMSEAEEKPPQGWSWDWHK